ncbi:angiogenic factor with G patch and FHA domains 1 isoform X2 [Drosophila erecta]|uniref:angiogenic factor with G patch and FHA domains 1 isoform X2 n=1 Tax=Drosophila erecta TaxID=7220 RepID=UPI000F05FE44|nr:angiogenic factor with G patch and FHA domains 1 isoform X2 [Drosophila erecta]
MSLPAEDDDLADTAAKYDSIELKSMQDLEACEQQQLLQYVEKLHGIIRKYDTKLAAYKQKLIHYLSREEKISCDKASQATESDPQGCQDFMENDEDTGKKNQPNDLSATDAFSFVDEMRQAAKHAENLNNFVYEPTSGMYYDPKTGYYYNAEYGLYYDGNTGCYYSYDHAKDSYEFHSQAQVQPLSDCAFSSLLAGFHKLSIDRMRSNALGERGGQTRIGRRGSGGGVR